MGHRFDALHSEMNATRFELRGEIHALHSRLLMWMLPTVITSIGASAALARLV